MTAGNSQFLQPRGFAPRDWQGEWERYEVDNEGCRREYERPPHMRDVSALLPLRYAVAQVREIYRNAAWRGVSSRRSA